MNILFIDSHSEIITIALMINNEVHLIEKESHFEHGVFLMSMIKEIIEKNNLKVNDIDKIVAVNGPGSFTGLRIGLTIAKTLAYTLNKPIYLVDTLACYLVSSNIEGNKKAVMEDNKGYYTLVFDKDNKCIEKEKYTEELTEDYPIVENKLDIKKVIDYALTFESIPCHLVRANYVKKIEVEK